MAIKSKVWKLLGASLLSVGAVSACAAVVAHTFTKETKEAQALYTPNTHYEVSDTASELTSYYSSISSSATGTTLLSQLQSLNSTKRKKTMGYSTMNTSVSNSPYIYTDYVLSSSSTDSNGQRYGTSIASFYTKTSATSWNREHMWPNSRGGSAVEGDILHTRPTISSENSSRGNSFYVEGMNHSSNGWDPYTAGYEEWVRGECARTILYCVVANSSFSLSDASAISSGQTGYSSTMGDMDTLIKWHFAYTPNEYEINRNNGAEYLQGNRNPFVDHPEYVAKIWSNFNTNISTICSNNASTYSNWTVGSCSTYGTNDASGGASTDPSISINASANTVQVGKTITLTANKRNLTGTVQWYIGDSSTNVLTLSATSGDSITVTGVAEGTKTIYAYIGSVSANVSITVTAASSIGAGDKVTSIDMLSNDDKVVIRTDESTPKGVTGWNSTKDATVSTTQNDWKEFTVKSISSSGFKLYDSSASKYIASPTGNEFKYDTSGGACSVDSDGHLICNSRYLCVNGTNYRFYGSIGSYTPFFVYLSGGSSSTKTLSSIAISNATTSYTVGDTFVKPTVTATYSDSTTANVTSSTTFSGYNMSTTGNQTVTASYTEGGVTKTATYQITVNAAAKTLSSIAVSGQTTTFTQGGTFSFGGTVTATYSDSSTANVTSSSSFSGYNLSNTGNQTVTVSYTEGGVTKTTTYQITVNASQSTSTATFTPSDFTGQGTTSTGSPISATKSTVTFSYDKGYGTSEIRCYAGGTLTISSTNTISAIAFTFSGDKNGGLNTSYTGLSTTSWTQSLSSQARITECTVTYAPSGTPASISLNKSSALLTVGDSVSLTATTSGGSGNVSWTATVGSSYVSLSASSGNSVTVTGVAAGSATITATYSGETATCTITVIASGGSAIPSTSYVFSSNTTTYDSNPTFASVTNNYDSSVFTVTSQVSVRVGGTPSNGSNTAGGQSDYMIMSGGSLGIALNNSDYIISKVQIAMCRNLNIEEPIVSCGGLLKEVTDYTSMGTYNFYPLQQMFTIEVAGARVFVSSITISVTEKTNEHLAWGQSFLEMTQSECTAGSGISSSTWSDCSTVFGNVSSDGQVDICYCVANKNGNACEEAVARYDDIMSKYNGLSDFLARGSTSNNIRFMSMDSVATTAVIISVFATLTGITCLSYFFLKKKKER